MCDMIFNIDDAAANHSKLQQSTAAAPSGGRDVMTESDRDVIENSVVPVSSNEESVNACYRDLSNPLIDAADIKSHVEQLKLRPANGQTVDFVVFIDDDIPDWEFQLSPSGSTQSLDIV